MNLRAEPITAAAMVGFGALIEAPQVAGVRNFYTPWLGSGRVGATPRMWVNRVAETVLPYAIGTLERHVNTAQIFLPMDVERYLVVVAPTCTDGSPQVEKARVFVAPGTVGICYGAGVWHAGATSLARAGSFGVVMWRDDTAEDEEFFRMASGLVVLPSVAI